MSLSKVGYSLRKLSVKGVGSDYSRDKSTHNKSIMTRVSFTKKFDKVHKSILHLLYYGTEGWNHIPNLPKGSVSCPTIGSCYSYQRRPPTKPQLSMAVIMMSEQMMRRKERKCFSFISRFQRSPDSLIFILKISSCQVNDVTIISRQRV